VLTGDSTEATGFNGDRRHAMLGVNGRCGSQPEETHMRMRSTALVGVALVLASGCGGQLGAGSVDAARAACIEAARKRGDQPIETENVKVLGEGRYEMSVRNKGTLGSSVKTCTYDKNIGAAIK
jgi:hypothetical protein